MLSFQYPTWFLFFCVAIAIIASGLMYYKNDKFNEPLFFIKKRKYLLWVLRFLSVFFIAFLLLSPLIKTKWTETEKPIILLLNDNSASIKIKQPKADSVLLFNQLEKIKSALSADYELKEYSFGSQLHYPPSINYQDKSTDISTALVDLFNQYNNQNVGAVILATDGIYNQGSNPIYTHGDWLVPIFTIALGDTTFKKDFYLSNATYNKTCYLNDQTPVKLELGGNFLNGETANIIVEEINGTERKNIIAKNILIGGNQFSNSVDFLVDAKRLGILHYHITATKFKDEITYSNNEKDIFIEVLESRQKIVIVANSPHPDVAALKNIIEANNNYDCQLELADNFNVNVLNDANLVILHQLPSNKFSIQNIISKANEKNLSVLFVVGTLSNLNQFNQLQNLVQVNGNAANTNETQAAFNKDFSAFTIEEATWKAMQNFPPLFTSFGDYKLSANANVLAYQKINSATTKYPLISFADFNGKKVGVISGEGIWKWRLHDYLQHQNQNATDEIIQKTIQYLVVKNDKRNFKAVPTKSLYSENESIQFEAYLYNDNYELINQPDVALSVTNEKLKEYKFNFSKTNNSYQLSIGGLPMGNYNYLATTHFNGKDLQSKGIFSVVPLQLEGLQTVANHQMLYTLSKKTGGDLFYPTTANSIVEAIKKSEKIKPIIYSKYKINTLLNLKWMFFLLLLLLAAEWFLRKYWGSY